MGGVAPSLGLLSVVGTKGGGKETAIKRLRGGLAETRETRAGAKKGGQKKRTAVKNGGRRGGAKPSARQNDETPRRTGNTERGSRRMRGPPLIMGSCSCAVCVVKPRRGKRQSAMVVVVTVVDWALLALGWERGGGWERGRARFSPLPSSRSNFLARARRRETKNSGACLPSFDDVKKSPAFGRGRCVRRGVGWRGERKRGTKGEGQRDGKGGKTEKGGKGGRALRAASLTRRSRMEKRGGKRAPSARPPKAPLSTALARPGMEGSQERERAEVGERGGQGRGRGNQKKKGPARAENGKNREKRERADQARATCCCCRRRCCCCCCCLGRSSRSSAWRRASVARCCAMSSAGTP